LSHRAIFKAVKEGRGVDAQQAMYFHLLYNENRYIEGQNNITKKPPVT
jgi:DNA-binding FadR family transcriptional regulator